MSLQGTPRSTDFLTASGDSDEPLPVTDAIKQVFSGSDLHEPCKDLQFSKTRNYNIMDPLLFTLWIPLVRDQLHAGSKEFDQVVGKSADDLNLPETENTYRFYCNVAYLSWSLLLRDTYCTKDRQAALGLLYAENS